MPGFPEWLSASAVATRLRTRYRGLLHRAEVEREMQEEFRHHLEERAAHLMRDGLAPAAARDRARREFGHQGTFRDLAREAKGLEFLAQLRFSWLDVKVGLRMVRKHPMLNLAAVFALAVGIPVGLAPSHLARALHAPLPGDGEDRLRAIRFWDPLSSAVAPTWDSDFTAWASSLQSFGALGALRTSSYNVAAADGQAIPAAGAQVSVSVFPMLGTQPRMGRLLTDEDFVPGAPDVVVIGHALWASRFGQDPRVLGQSLRIGRRVHEVIGVMPEGFGFPANEVLWLPFRPASIGGIDERARVHVIGRLGDGVSTERAQAEVSAVARPHATHATTAAELAERGRLRAEVVPFGLLFLNLPAGGLVSLPEFRYAQAMMFALLLVACGNVAMLVFARTATRLRELAIRTSLGASRARIVSQIFVETLLLAVIAAGVGVLVFDGALGRVNVASLAAPEATALPYWLSLDLTATTALTALALAAVSATVAGVLPAIAITGRAVAQNIRGGTRFRFGKLTAALVIADIAVSVAAIGMAFAVSGHATDLQVATRATGLPASEYLAVEVRLPDGTPKDADTPARRQAQLAAAQRALLTAIEGEPGVRRAAVADVLPRMEHRSLPYEVEGVERAPDTPRRWTRIAHIDVDFLKALGTPMLNGRDFVRTDVEGDTRVAIVNTAFVERVLGGRDPLGQRVRFPSPTDTSSGEWREVVGVIGPLGVNVVNADQGAAVYLPAAPGTLNPMQIAVHTVIPPASLAGRVRELVREVNPDLVVGRAVVLSDVRQSDWYLVMGVAVGLVVLVGVLIALATSGLYAMLSLAVSERRREIGIRAALGAPRHALVLTVLRRSAMQVGVGAALGLPLAARFVLELSRTPDRGGSVSLSLGVALGFAVGIVALVGLCSGLVPTRRILAIQSREAMSAGE